MLVFCIRKSKDSNRFKNILANLAKQNATLLGIKYIIVKITKASTK